jgi:hypothetical protein
MFPTMCPSFVVSVTVFQPILKGGAVHDESLAKPPTTWEFSSVGQTVK